MKKQDVDPKESLETIRATLQRVRRELFCRSGPVYKAWGLAWLIAFVLTDLVERGVLRDLLPGLWITFVWIFITGGAGIYTFLYFRRQPVSSAVGTRFGLVWPIAFAMMGSTVGSLTAAGLNLHSIEFAVVAVHTLAVIYLVTGAILFDNLQIAVGVWLGAANFVGLQLGVESYPLVVGMLVGGGQIVAGFIDDRLHQAGGDGR